MTDYVTEDTCKDRTEKILNKLDWIKGDTEKIDKALIKHLAEETGRTKFINRIGSWMTIIGLLLAAAGVIGGTTWAVAKMSQPDMNDLAMLVAKKVNGDARPYSIDSYSADPFDDDDSVRAASP